MIRVFTLPESDDSTLVKLEKQISNDLIGFLGEHIVAGDLSAKEIERHFSDTKIADDPVFVSEQTDFLLKQVVAQSVHTSSPSFIGHMTSALPYFMLPLSKIMFALNQNLVKIETSKAFTPLERQVLGMVHRLIYANSDPFYKSNVQSHKTALGSFCSGGTIANLTALWVARSLLFKAQGSFPGFSAAGWIKSLQYFGYQDIAVVMSERAHYSIEKSAKILGIGNSGLIKVPTKQGQKIDLQALEKTLQGLRKDKIAVLALIGVAGTTESGSVDPLEQMAVLAKQYGCYFHVDAAWGGPTLFSERYRHLLSGIELADSVTFDAHKQLYVPVGGGMVLFKDPKALQSIEHHAQYIIRKGSRDLGRHSIEGSRPGMALLTHSALRVLGRKGLALLIELGIEKARLFAKLIKEDLDFELMAEPELNLINYRFVPKNLRKQLKIANSLQKRDALNEQINKITIEIQKTQREHGKTFVSRTSLSFPEYGAKSITVFRAVLANPLTSPEILKNILQEQKQIALQLGYS